MVTTKDIIEALHEIPLDMLNEDYRDYIEVALTDKERLDMFQERIDILQQISGKKTSTFREVLDSLF